MNIGGIFVRAHRRLLPESPGLGWLPYVWLVYLSFFFIRYYYVTPGTIEAALAALSILVFLALYFHAWWLRGWALVPHIAGMTLIGIAWAPINPGANVFFIFAASFAGFLGPRRRAMAAIGLVVAAAVVMAWSWQQSPVFWMPALLFSVLIGVVNIYYAGQARKDAALRMSQAEVRQLAQVAERERISRDLHDLLGHTLSVITLKAELAGRLMQRDPERARAEIADVEGVSRAALAQVREAVSGMRKRGLASELEHAGLALKAAGIVLQVDGAVPPLPPAREAVLALVLREAVTNVIRHSGAFNCMIRFRLGAGELALEIHDDGRGGSEVAAGSGIDGMRARLAGVGGWLDINGDSGTRLQARVPLDGEPG